MDTSQTRALQLPPFHRVPSFILCLGVKTGVSDVTERESV